MTDKELYESLSKEALVRTLLKKDKLVEDAHDLIDRQQQMLNKLVGNDDLVGEEF